ncbi:ROK family transcriptional regulator [Streptomyces sp. NBC_00445]|nr:MULTISPECIES: ROK family protein [unclassified Streptomyces]
MPQHHDGPLARLRRGHEELVLDLLRRHGPLSRAELGRHSGLSRTTLYDIIAALVDSGAVVASAPAPAERRRGRPVETLTLRPEAGQAIGIDFARRAVHVAAVNVAHEVIGSASEPHAPGLPWEERVDLAERLVRSLAGGTLRLGALSAIGVGVVGPVEDGAAGASGAAAEASGAGAEPVGAAAEASGAGPEPAGAVAVASGAAAEPAGAVAVASGAAAEPAGAVAGAAGAAAEPAGAAVEAAEASARRSPTAVAPGEPEARHSDTTPASGPQALRADLVPGAQAPRADLVPGTQAPRADLASGPQALRADLAPGAQAPRADLAPGPQAPRTDLALLLRKRFGVPVLVDNNTRLAALAEATWGAAAGDQDVLYLRLSHGVGGGLVVGGSLHRGAHGLSGEFGHITVEPDGRRCSCGGRGCLETVASVGAVLDAHGGAGDLPALLAALPADPAAHRVLDAAGTHIGTVLAAVCNAIGPGVIVLGGELAAAGDVLFESVERALTADLMPISRHRVDLRPATLGESGGALGAIALVLHESPLLARYPAPPDPLEDT